MLAKQANKHGKENASEHIQISEHMQISEHIQISEQSKQAAQHF